MCCFIFQCVLALLIVSFIRLVINVCFVFFFPNSPLRNIIFRFSFSDDLSSIVFFCCTDLGHYYHYIVTKRKKIKQEKRNECCFDSVCVLFCVCCCFAEEFILFTFSQHYFFILTTLHTFVLQRKSLTISQFCIRFFFVFHHKRLILYSSE